MPRERAKRQIRTFQRAFDQAKAVGGGAENAVEIGGVGLVGRIAELAILPRRQRIHDPRLEARGAIRLLHGQVITSRPLDGHNQIGQVMPNNQLAQLADGTSQRPRRMQQFLRRQQPPTIEVGEHPHGGAFGTIDSHNPKPLRPHSRHPRLDDPQRLAHISPFLRLPHRALEHKTAPDRKGGNPSSTRATVGAGQLGPLVLRG